MRKIVPLSLWLWWASVIPIQAAPSTMRLFVIDLPHHVLRFLLPEEVAREMTPLQVEKRLDLNEPGVFDGDFRLIAGHLYDFKGPFGVVAYGSLKFHFMIQKRKREYHGEITSVDGLERYVRWWNGKIDKDAVNCVFSRSTLNGAAAVRREWNSFGNQNKREPEDFEIFSLPLDEDMFLDVGFKIKEWEGGRGKEGKWKGKAEALRDAIKSTIVLSCDGSN